MRKIVITDFLFFEALKVFKTQYHADEIGETIWEYHENGVVKSICSTYINVENDKEGNQISTEIFNCNRFDKNGCLIKDQTKQANTDK